MRSKAIVKSVVILFAIGMLLVACSGEKESAALTQGTTAGPPGALPPIPTKGGDSAEKTEATPAPLGPGGSAPKPSASSDDTEKTEAPPMPPGLPMPPQPSGG